MLFSDLLMLFRRRSVLWVGQLFGALVKFWVVRADDMWHKRIEEGHFAPSLDLSGINEMEGSYFLRLHIGAQ
jgi:hypothetical protein